MALVITLLVVGALLMLAETILPGLIAGIVGFCCLVAGVIFSYIEFGPKIGNLVLIGVMVGLVTGFLLWLKYFPESRAAKVFVSQRAVGNINAEKPELLNQTGVAHTQLRPAGTAVINGKRVDVVTEGALIERGTAIKVIGLEGIRVVVRAL